MPWLRAGGIDVNFPRWSGDPLFDDLVTKGRRRGIRSRSVSTLGGRALLFIYPDFHPFGNLAQRSVQHLGDPPQAAHRRVEDSSFHAANVSAVEATLAAEALLRVARPLTEFTHDGPDGSHFQIGRLDLLLAPLHQQIRWCYVEAYQPTAYTPHLQGAAGAQVPRKLERNVARSRSDVVFLRTEWTSRFSH